MRPEIFRNETVFKQAFCSGLKTILQQPDLGCFILVCANAFADTALYRQMLPDIEKQFEFLQQSFLADGMEKGDITATDEDREIFQKIIERGLQRIPTAQYRQTGNWRCQFNHLRTFRPQRMAANKICNLYQDYNKDGFNFNKSFLQKERLWQGLWHDKTLSWYYNKFPFAHYHGLLVPERDKHQPQYLTQESHEFIWNLLQDCSADFSGLGIGYNSLGAFASVNHLHFQWFIEADGLPVMSSHWRHNGGTQDYPLHCYRETDPQQAWQRIRNWHEQSIPYNLIYTVNGLYAVPRQIQSQITHHNWTSGFSWIEAAGEMVIQNAAAFMQLDAEDIELEMSKLKLSTAELSAI